MKLKTFSKILAIFFVLFTLCGCSTKPYIDSQNDFAATDTILEKFNTQGQPIDCPAYRELEIIEYFGNCIYFDEANIQATSGASGDTLVVQYELSPLYDWGNWLSIRKTVTTPYDLSKYSGVKLRIRTQDPVKATLRFTIVDINPKQVPYASDEMWWCDFESVLQDGQGEWQVFVCPFRSFVLSEGFGARQNDLTLDLRNVIAFEISILSQENTMIKGSMEIDGIAAYK